MGGTYWYFVRIEEAVSVKDYRLDGDSEQHDSDEPSTTTCPLLPGQQVNVLDVPTQQQDEEHRPCTLLESSVFTMDPKAKYSPLKPPVRQDAIQQLNPSDRTAAVAPAPGDGKLQRLFSSTTSALSTADLQPLRRTRANTSQGPCITLPKGSALMAMFHKIRGARSAPSSTKPRGSERSTPSRLRGETEPCSVPIRHCTPTKPSASRVSVPLNTPEWPLAPSQAVRFSADPSIKQPSSMHTPSRVSSRCQSRTASRSTLPAESSDASEHYRSLPVSRSDKTSARPSNDYHGCRPENTAQSPSATAATTSTTARDENQGAQTALPIPSTEEDNLDAVHGAASPLALPIESNAPPPPSKEPPRTHPTGLRRTTRSLSLLYNNGETLQTFYAASSSCGGQLSPHCLSQPETPSVRDFEEASGGSSASRAGSQGLSSTSSDQNPIIKTTWLGDDNERESADSSPRFPDYSLPEQETLRRKPASAVFAADGDAIATTQNDNDDDEHQLVRSWNDGSSGQMTTTTKTGLVDELGYLGRAII
ncbi:MAG: hypothetical protein LQ348_005976 [Seirophora lacunosa]|nr:MAG: hypothetical protein LQ348_005976 [Seirophora lacunosa]